MQGLPKRVATGAIFVLIMLIGVFGGRYTFAALFGLIACLCLLEYLAIVFPKEQPHAQEHKYLGLIYGLLPVAISALVHLGCFSQVSITHWLLLGMPLLSLLLVVEMFFAKANQPFSNIAYLLMGVVYIGFPFAAISSIAYHSGEYSARVVFGLLLLTWLNDTGAYFVGSMVGRTPLFKRISPKKTWEGTMGGVFFTLLTAVSLYYAFGELSMTQWLVIGGIIAVFASIGDLVESMLKRSANIKDSGTLLPGHGGVLDRFDGFLFCLPFVMAYLICCA